jgi:hypothetical protein
LQTKKKVKRKEMVLLIRRQEISILRRIFQFLVFFSVIATLFLGSCLPDASSNNDNDDNNDKYDDKNHHPFNVKRQQRQRQDSLGSTSNYHELFRLHSIEQHLLQPPQQILKEYIQWHSKEHVLNNNNNNNNNHHQQQQKYQIIYYSCPASAGNILHDVFNQVIVAIALNRTMVWKYYDKVSYAQRRLFTHHRHVCFVNNG